MVAGGDGAGSIGGIKPFLRALGCRSLVEVERRVEDEVETDSWVYGLGRFASEGIIVRVAGRGTELNYPFSIGEFWNTVGDLEAEHLAPLQFAYLAEEIEAIEGFPVSVEVSPAVEGLDEDSARQGPYLIAGDAWIRPPGPYPYKRPMGRNKTFSDWVLDRFERHFPELEATAGIQGVRVSRHVTLAELRAAAQDAYVVEDEDRSLLRTYLMTQTVPELRLLGHQRHLRGLSVMRKDQLVGTLMGGYSAEECRRIAADIRGFGERMSL